MRYVVMIGAALILLCPARAQNRSHVPEQPKQFEIGRHTFFDFGPPTDFYELFVVRPDRNGTSIERITLTPPGMGCNAHPKIETKSALIGKSPQTLLGSTNPCAIPEKEIRRELKRCKKCLTFSGVNVELQVQCGSQTRVIRSDILDKDIFDPAAKTPEHTSWTMRLLQSLDQAVGPGVMEKPTFPTSEEPDRLASDLDPTFLEDLSSGKYDGLFQGAPDKLSDLYRGSLIQGSLPSVRLMSSTPYAPEQFALPAYPLIANLAHVEGIVSLTIHIGADGNIVDPSSYAGQPILRHVVETAVSTWKFPIEAASKQVQITLEFVLNCPNTHSPSSPH
jgi:hypothetical protein